MFIQQMLLICIFQFFCARPREHFRACFRRVMPHGDSSQTHSDTRNTNIVGLAIMMTDVYQTPVILAEGLFSEIKGFFSEAVRGKNELPFNHANPQSPSLNKLGRPRRFVQSDFRFSGQL
ncbi:unnamed protein product [Amoebophrya sp. A120]|nr:unnamed protein product [Amoebophrya sp. A120]|eukprot:GSA120T00007560001.1